MKRLLGTTGRSITAIGLGAMPLSLQGRPDERSAVAVIARFVEAGGDFVDTANVYCLDRRDVGHNERLVSSALRGMGATERVLVATKGGLTREHDAWDTDGRPAWLRQSCERSLRDLGTERIFLYQLHAPDPAVPFEDSIRELARLREEGKIEHVGLSNVDVHQIETALAITPIVAVQNKLNVLYRKSVQNGVVDFCREKGIAFIAHSAVGGHFGHRALAEARELQAIAGARGVTPYQLALAWLLRLGKHIIPIPGASRVQSVDDSLRAMSLRLSDAEMERLDRLSDA